MTAAIELDNLENWREHEAMAEAMIPVIGTLYRDRDVILYSYGRKLTRESAVGILRAHRFARQITKKELLVTDTFPVLEALTELELDPAKIDIGKLATEWAEDAGDSLDAFLRRGSHRCSLALAVIVENPPTWSCTASAESVGC